ncbi:uncharacterized protein [Mytilus edulis]|uniref:uncharacterized protein isoform X3 n=1 Tax=Mytilus edulis TaxID=6550 RepID=UPI0039EEEB28
MQMNYICIVTLLCLIFLDGTSSYVYAIKETACQRELRIYQQEPNVPGRRIPVCDALGNYAHKQCSGSQCYCVLKNGTHISGFSVNNWEAEQQTCYCAREQAEYQATGLIGKMFRCTIDGSYDSIQCTGPYCYCADQHGKQIGESSVHITEMNSLNCIIGKETACQRELRIYQQEPNVPGRRIPVCDSIGNYAHKQCSGSQCYCVLKNGTHIPGFYVNVWEAEQQTCYCAREQAEYEATGLVGKMFRCTNDGSYDSIQCTGQYCYCAWHGKQIGESSVHNRVHITEINSLNCIFGKETTCHRELRIHRWQPKVPGRRIPVCDSRGHYAHKQCSGSQCYCVLKNGTPIPGFYVNVWEAEQQTCYCAHEQAEYEATRLVGNSRRVPRVSEKQK